MATGHHESLRWLRSAQAGPLLGDFGLWNELPACLIAIPTVRIVPVRAAFASVA